jgi:lipopolysaccharide/colanic/teichoic acid biosynthesis glycosyltransferase
MLGLLFLSAPLAVLWLISLVKIGKPVFFRQERAGWKGRVFTMFKFRTMKDDRLPDGSPAPDEVRLTPYGKMLRSTSLDELPELFNILKGDMSLVGPRPLLVRYLGRYSPEQARRHDVRPGLTGWAQVNGRNALDWEERFKLDVWYVDNCTFLLDLRIIGMTLGKVVKRADVSAEGHATMTEFMGSTPSLKAPEEG